MEKFVHEFEQEKPQNVLNYLEFDYRMEEWDNMP